MRSLPSTLVVLCFVFTLSASATYHDTAFASVKILPEIQDTIHLRGILQNNDANQFAGSRVDFSLPTLDYRKVVIGSSIIEGGGTFDIPILKKDGFLEITIEIKGLYTGKFLINSDLTIVFDFSEIQVVPFTNHARGIKFVGDNAAINQFCALYDSYKQERKEELLKEKIEVMFDFSLTRNQKVEKIQKLYKKLAGIENSFSKKHGLEFQRFLRDDRIATMYADLISLYWGSKMRTTAFEEYSNFKPSINSFATVQYYDFLTRYLTTQSRIEQKMFFEQTLKSQIPQNKSASKLDQFLREYEKKREHLNYDQKIFSKGKEEFLDRHADLLYQASVQWKVNRIKSLSEEKFWISIAMSLPCNVEERSVFVEEVRKFFPGNKAVLDIERQLQSQRNMLKVFNSKISHAAFETDIDTSKRSTLTSQDSQNQDHNSIYRLFTTIREEVKGRGALIEISIPDFYIEGSTSVDENLHEQIIDSLNMLIVTIHEKNNAGEEELAFVKSKNRTDVYVDENLRRKIIEYFQIRMFPALFLMDKVGNIDLTYLNEPSRLNFERLSTKKIEEQKI